MSYSIVLFPLFVWYRITFLPCLGMSSSFEKLVGEGYKPGAHNWAHYGLLVQAVGTTISAWDHLGGQALLMIG